MVADVRPDLLVLFYTLSSAILGAAPAAAQVAICADCPSILIAQQVSSAKERTLLCDSAAKAQHFFQAHGVHIRDPIIMSIRNAEDGDLFPHVGAYSLDQRQIRILSLEQAANRDGTNTLFGFPIDDALYSSVVVHEIAHAISDQNFEIPNPSLVAREYLAYVAQLSTMDPEVRDKTLGRYALAPYAGIDEMSAVYYQMAPSRFGIKAYLHFLRLKDPGSFIRGLLSGEVTPAGIEVE